MSNLTIEGFNLGSKYIIDDIIKIMDSITDFVLFLGSFNLFENGVAFLKSFIDGVKSVVGGLYDTVAGAFDTVKNLLPFSDAKEGPFSRLTESGKAIVDTLADGIRHAQPLKVALMAGALAAPAASRPASDAARLSRRAAGSGTRAG